MLDKLIDKESSVNSIVDLTVYINLENLMNTDLLRRYRALLHFVESIILIYS